MTRLLDNPEKTVTRLNKYRANLKKCKQMKNRSSLQDDAIEPEGGDSIAFLLLPRLPAWVARS